MKNQPASPGYKNRLLARLPKEEFRRLEPHLSSLETRTNQVIYEY